MVMMIDELVLRRCVDELTADGIIKYMVWDEGERIRKALLIDCLIGWLMVKKPAVLLCVDEMMYYARERVRGKKQEEKKERVLAFIWWCVVSAIKIRPYSVADRRAYI